MLAKNKSLFNDKSVEIQELTLIIKEDINGLNKDIAKVRFYEMKGQKSEQSSLYLLVCICSSKSLLEEVKVPTGSTFSHIPPVSLWVSSLNSPPCPTSLNKCYKLGRKILKNKGRGRISLRRDLLHLHYHRLPFKAIIKVSTYYDLANARVFY